MIPNTTTPATKVWCIDWNRVYAAEVVAVKLDSVCLDYGDRLTVVNVSDCWPTAVEAWQSLAARRHAEGMKALELSGQAMAEAEKARREQ